MRIGWVVALTMLGGTILAVVLDVVVFYGAAVHVITGVALLSFSFGWGVLAAASARLTDQPQRWAGVPCTAMGLTGAAVLVLAHSNGAMENLGWVWPPLLLVLSVWMIVQVRRSLRSWTRRAFMYPVLGFLVIAALGGAFETVQERLDRSTYAMPGTLVDVGGHSLHIHCTGSGTPTVVLEGGRGRCRRSSDGSPAAIARGTRVCVYDRSAGGGASPHRVPGAEWRRNSIRCSIGRMCLVRTCWRGTRSAGSTFSTSPW